MADALVVTWLLSRPLPLPLDSIKEKSTQFLLDAALTSEVKCTSDYA